LNEVNEKILGKAPVEEDSIEPSTKVSKPDKIWGLTKNSPTQKETGDDLWTTFKEVCLEGIVGADFIAQR
jgi:hypothetical protein